LRFPSRRERPKIVPLSSWSLRSIFARSLRSLTAATLWWGLVIATYTALLIVLLHQVEQNLTDLLRGLTEGNPVYAEMVGQLLGGQDVETNVALLNGIFTLLTVALAAFAATLANRWAADEEEGRLELLLGTPQSRPRVILARFAAVLVALLAVAGLLFAGAALGAAAVGMKLDTSRLAQGAFGMVPVALVVAALGYLLASWLRTAAVTGSLIAFLFASFLLSFLGPLFHWPDLLVQLSLFHHYGAPLVEGLRASSTLGLLAVAGAALAIATTRFARKDLSG
jgi:ABC-2 type transport system permease protein